MGRIDALAVVASMANTHPIRDRTVLHRVSYTMGENITLGPEPPIPRRIKVPGPLDATRVDLVREGRESLPGWTRILASKVA